MSDDLVMTVETIPVLDMGIGRQAGYGSDAELLAAAEQERAALSPAVRDALDAVDAVLMRRLAYGD